MLRQKMQKSPFFGPNNYLFVAKRDFFMNFEIQPSRAVSLVHVKLIVKKNCYKDTKPRAKKQ